MPKLQTVDPSTSQEQQPTHDGKLHLARNLNIHPDTLIGSGNGILGAGMPGAGKTTVLARLLEQFGLCGFPFAAFDLEGDLAPLIGFLPRGVLATPTNCPTVQEIYKEGLQVVFDLAAWGRDVEAMAVLITTVVNGLIDYAHALPRNLRVPFLVALDEAAYWLPQTIRGRNYLSEEQFKEVFTAFHDLALRGRKMGMVPMLFTQRFADVHKDVLTTTGTYILMRQSIDTELKRYLEYINTAAWGQDDLTDKQVKARIAAFKPGQAVIKLPNGKQGIIQFHNRESEHISHAPKTQAALNAYRNVEFDSTKRYGAFGAVEVLPVDDESRGYGDKTKRIQAALAEDRTLSSGKLAKLVGCSRTMAHKVRTAYLQG